jgi:hypothetical protein
LEPSEVVGDEKTGRVGEVRDVVGITDKETSDTGHGYEDLSSAPARNPAKRKESRIKEVRTSNPKRYRSK